MSDATGAPQLPNQPTSGQSNNVPLNNSNSGGDDNASNNLNMWTKDEKTKTCKCEPCGERVRFWSMKCNHCGRHVCSECLDGSSDKTAYMKAVARDHVDLACWCKFRSNMNPTFRNWKPAPPIRAEEEWQAKKSKGLVGPRATKTSVSRRPRRKDTTAEGNDGSPDAGSDSHADEPDAEYRGSNITTYTMTSMKTQRRSIKRQAYDEGNSDVSIEDAKEEVASNKRLKREHAAMHSLNEVDKKSIGRTSIPLGSAAVSVPSRLAGGHTVIVGAGFIGLFIARELALKFKEAALEHTITIVEIRENHCELASGNCAGLLTTSGISEQWRELSDLAVLSWRDIISSQEASRALGFSRTTSYLVTDSGGERHEQSPAWFRIQPQQSIHDDDNAIGRINPTKLSAWLYEECEKLDVIFRFNHCPVRLVSSDRLGITGIRIQNSKTGSQEELDCTNVVLAAGPFTTTTLKGLYSDNAFELENNVKFCDWFRTPVAIDHSHDQSALTVQGAAANSGSLGDQVFMVPKVDNHVIEISAVSRRAKNVHVELSDALQPTNGRTRELRNIAAQYLEVGDLDVTYKPQARVQGRWLISTANGDCPILDKVPAFGLGMIDSEGHVAATSGVWLCNGFGHHGTTLAPGAARVLGRKMCGESAGVNDLDFCLPGNVNLTTNLRGKGKGRKR